MKVLCFNHGRGKCQGHVQGNQRTQYLVAIAATLCIFNTGIHVGWPSSAVPKILSPEFPFEVTSDEASTILVIGFLGDMIGGVLSCYLFDKFGRKKTLIGMAVPQTFSFFFIYLSYYSKELLYLARFLGGFAEAALFYLCALYVSEIAEPKVRGRLGSLASISCQIAIVSINVYGTYFSLYTTALISMVPPVIFMILFSKMPETPYYLLMIKKPKEAEDVLKYLLSKSNVEKELALLTQDVQRQMSEKGSFKDLFVINCNRKALLCAAASRVVQQFSGCTAFGLYAQILMANSITFLTPLEGSTLMLLVQLAMTIVASILVDKFGRKPLFIVSSTGCFLALVANSIYLTLRDYSTIDISSLEILPLILIIIYQIFFSSGLQTLVNLVTSELFSATIKSRALSLLNVWFAVLALSSLKYYQFMADHVGMAVPFWTFGLVTFSGIIFFLCFFPETKGKRLEEIQQELKGTKPNKKEVTSR